MCVVSSFHVRDLLAGERAVKDRYTTLILVEPVLDQDCVTLVNRCSNPCRKHACTGEEAENEKSWKYESARSQAEISRSFLSAPGREELPRLPSPVHSKPIHGCSLGSRVVSIDGSVLQSNQIGC